MKNQKLHYTTKQSRDFFVDKASASIAVVYRSCTAGLAKSVPSSVLRRFFWFKPFQTVNSDKPRNF